MIRRLVKFSALSLFLFVLLNAFLIIVTNVSTKPTDSDAAIFRSALGLKKLLAPLNYEEEIKLIKELQTLVLNEISGFEPIPDYLDREPEDLFKIKSGLCYDRSRTFDKLFSWYGFETRHVYILYAEHPKTGEQLSFWSALITKGTQSHAVTEVKTSRGWLVVDSNKAWVSVAVDGLPVGADSLYAQADRFQSMPDYWGRPYWAIRGLYSRRGQLYRPFIPYPQLNWPDFFSWIVQG